MKLWCWGKKDECFSGTIRLKSTPCPKFSACVLGDQQHCDEAKAMDIPQHGHQGLNKAGEFLSLLIHSENIVAKADEVKSTIKFLMKKVLRLAVAVGHVKMTDDEPVYSIHLAGNFLASLLKKTWRNVRALYSKSIMGKPQCLC
ncbi:ribosomal protein L10a isoform 9-like protein [Camelus ferus]|nr:ribosomal protein L10a isoform 9-like protein [Camelus ferus]